MSAKFPIKNPWVGYALSAGGVTAGIALVAAAPDLSSKYDIDRNLFMGGCVILWFSILVGLLMARDHCNRDSKHAKIQRIFDKLSKAMIPLFFVMLVVVFISLFNESFSK